MVPVSLTKKKTSDSLISQLVNFKISLTFDPAFF
jgi:hypothetical protein